MPCSQTSSLKNSVISAMIARPTVLKFVRKNPDENPSGPGALSSCMENKASRIFLALRIVVSAILSVTEMRQVRASSIAAIGERELEVKSRRSMS